MSVGSIVVLIFGLLLPPIADEGGFRLDVPFVRQAEDGCGSATLAMVMLYWAGQAESFQDPPAVPSVEVIHGSVYSAEAKGSSGKAMARFLEEHGFRSFTFQAAWKDLESHLSKGRPLIVCLAPARKDLPMHYVVVAGLDSGRGSVWINDPARRKLLRMDRQEFESLWKAAGNWTLLAVPL